MEQLPGWYLSLSTKETQDGLSETVTICYLGRVVEWNEMEGIKTEKRFSKCAHLYVFPLRPLLIFHIFTFSKNNI